MATGSAWSVGHRRIMRAHLASLVEEFRSHVGETAVVAHRGNRRYATRYRELAELAGRFAAELEIRQIAPGERVVLWGENSAEWIGAFFGCVLRGVLVVPLDAAGSDELAERVIRDVSPRLVVGDRGLLEAFQGGEPKLLLDELASLLPLEPSYEVSPAVGPDAAFQIVFTSGTTSEPKGVVHTHRNVLASLQPIENGIAQYRRYERWVHPLRFLHTLPLSHVFGQFMGLWIPALLGAELHLSDALDAARIARTIRRERVSVLIAVPRVLSMLRGHLLGEFPGLEAELEASEGIRAWKRWWRFRRVHAALGWKFWAVISGGAALPSELETFWNRLGFALIQGYGMTETAALITLNHPFHISRGSIGKALPGREVKIGEDGEILVRGDMLSKAVWQGGAMRPRDGEWLATGDLASRDASGDLKFLGRKSDAIVTAAGMNVHPADVEAAMARQAGVRGCAVVGCELAGGAEPVAVVLFGGSDAELQEAVSAANVGLAEFQKIRRVLRWPEAQLPYTSTGKLLRRKVKDWACAALSGGRVEAGADSGTGTLLGLIAEVTGESVGAAEGEADRLRLSEDLHLDSLGRVQLQSLLEQRWGVEVGDDAMASARTVGDLRRLMGGSVAWLTDEIPPQTMRPSEMRHPSIDGGGNEDVYPRWPWSWLAQAVRVVFVEVVMRPVVWLLGAPKVSRATPNLGSGPLLIVANHVTAYDGALVLYALPWKLRHRVAAAMSAEMLRDLRHGRNQGNALLNIVAPVGYWLVTGLFNVFPLPRMAGFRRSFAHAGEAMDAGYSVMIFPEGTRSKDGCMHAFRPGIGLLAQLSRAAVLPVGLVGLSQLQETKARWFRSGKLAVRVGSAIPFDERAETGELTRRYEDAVRRLVEGD